MDYKNNECLGCGDVVEEVFCPKCGPGPGKAFDLTASVAVQVLPTPAINRFQCTALDNYKDGDQIALPVLEFLSGNSNKTIKKVLLRYKQVDSAKSLGLLFEENYIVEHIAKPLKQAYVNYLLGNWIACITTCGIACECLTILIWRMNQVEANVTINGIVNTPATNALIQDFEGLKQNSRIDILASASLISEQQKKDLHKIRDWRNDYVHYSTTIQNQTQSKAAREVFNLTAKLLQDFVVISVAGGKVQLSQQLSKYMERVSSSRSQA